MPAWKCSPPATQQPNRSRRAFSIAFGRCLGIWLSHWKDFRRRRRRKKARCCSHGALSPCFSFAPTERGGYKTPATANHFPLQTEPPSSFREIGLVDFEPDKLFHIASLRCYR